MMIKLLNSKYYLFPIEIYEYPYCSLSNKILSSVQHSFIDKLYNWSKKTGLLIN